MTLVLFAVPEEAAPFRRLAGTSGDRVILVTGMGAANARRETAQAIATRPALVLTCGFAGGLDPGLASGDVLFSLDPGLDWEGRLQSAGARAGTFHCAPRVAVTAGEKAALRESTGADAVEMESQVVRDLCLAEGIPSATIRVILDPAGEDLPLDFNALLNERQELAPAKLAAALLRSPWKVPALIRLRSQTNAAAARLAAALAAVTETPRGR